jgi:hypothetical protein
MFLVTLSVLVLGADAGCSFAEGATPDARLEAQLACDAERLFDAEDPLPLLGGLPTASGLRRLRNAYYARRGLRFASRDLSDFFSGFGWYVPVSGNVDDQLTDADRFRIRIVRALERRPSLQAELAKSGWGWASNSTFASESTTTTLCPDGRAFRTFDYSDYVSEPLLWGRWVYRRDALVAVRWTRSTGVRHSRVFGPGPADIDTPPGRLGPFDDVIDETESLDLLVRHYDSGLPPELPGPIGTNREDPFTARGATPPELCRSKKTLGWKGQPPGPTDAGQ